MSYETFHGIGSGPFKPNKDRGFWSNPHDFALVCLNNAMRVDNIYGIAIVPIVVTQGFFHVLLTFIFVVLFSVPVFFIQSFLGQFSSSGYISALRISPLFKGLGFVALGINVISLAFHGVLISIPMMFFIHSLQRTLPWSCEAPRPWETNLHFTLPLNGSEEDVEISVSHCNPNQTDMDTRYPELSVPSVEFFQHEVRDFNLDIFACELIVWAALAHVTYQGFEKVAMFLRNSTIVVVSLLAIVFIRMLFLPDIFKYIALERPYYTPQTLWWAMILPALTTFITFGPGCGSILTLASYNKFKTNIVQFSWQIPLCQLVIVMMLGMVSFCAEMHLIKDKEVLAPLFLHLWMSFMTIPSTLATLDYAHLWTWMFLIMLILGAFNLTMIQMTSVQTALFDEFEQLRPYRKEFIFGGCGVMALLSGLFCTTHGLDIIEFVVEMNQFSQCLFNLTLIVIVLWLYGRDRFQRDVEFMLNQVLPSWKFNYIRFVGPLFLGCILSSSFVFGMNYMQLIDNSGVLISLCVTYLPWIVLPAYCAYRLRLATGDWRTRLSRCMKPTDWYPVDPEDKQRYDTAFGGKDGTQPLTADDSA